MYRIAATLMLGLLAATPALAQNDRFADVKIKTTKVAPGIYMLAGAGGNMGLCVGRDGPLLIDDEFAPLSRRIKAAIAKVAKRPVRLLVNTHWHGDHTGGNAHFGGPDGAVIVAQDNVYRRLSTEQVSGLGGDKIPPSPPDALPVLTFDHAVTLHLNGDEEDVVHVAHAHTDGDAMIYFKHANVLHTGDIYFNGLYPFIDIGSGGSIDGMIAGAEKALELSDADTRIIPGHGPLSNRKELATYAHMLRTVRKRVSDMKAQGKTLDEVIAAKPSKEWDASWGKTFIKPEQFLGFVYQGV